MRFKPMAAGLMAAAVLAPTAASADAKAGKAIYAQCVSCHGVNGAGAPLGPGLAGIVGRRAGTEDGFAYSSAMKRSQIVWDEPTLKAFLVKPSAVLPGTRMIYSGAGSPQKADDLVAYLKSLR